MLVSAVQQSESAVRTHRSSPSWASLPSSTPSHPSRFSQSTGFRYMLHGKWLKVSGSEAGLFKARLFSASTETTQPVCTEKLLIDSYFERVCTKDRKKGKWVASIRWTGKLNSTVSWGLGENAKTTQRLTVFDKSMKMEGIRPLLEKDCVIVINDWERREHKPLTASVFTKKKGIQIGVKIIMVKKS